jgi:H+/Cl- antiporter ClcA
MFLLALVTGAGAGLGAVAFRYLIYFFTWLATGHSEFGQAGYVGSSHLPWLGPGFFVVIPAIGGLLYGPLIYRWAREARGHGVPEVMIAVADNGGRIRWQVSVVKALASALTIGSGGSVGREGPIVQIGSALASSIGQWVRMPENRLRIMVACGAAGGISATFNAPITGVFFGVEIILREFAVDALFTVILSAMIADVIAIPFLGDKPFLSGFPAGIALHHPATYLLVAVLAVVAALMGLAFAKVLYKVEDLCDALWKGRPEWARPAVLGLGFGLLLLALPQMYGVGYPVMYKTTAGGYALWFLIILAFGKILATSLSIGIGGSGGIFAPSLFIGVTSGYAYGDVVNHLFGAAAGQPALYAVVAMGAVFTSAARAPLTSLASVVEMSGDFSLTLPVMLAVAIASTVSRVLSYGTIYTTKLLRRGTDIDRSGPSGPPGVEVPGERGEDGQQGRGGEQYPGDLAGGRVSGQQAALGGDQVAGRVDADEGLQPPRHCGRLDEHVAGQGEREQHYRADAHHRLRSAQQQAERGPHPGQAQREGQQQPDPRQHAGRAAGRPVAHDHAEDGDQAGGDQVAGHVAEDRPGDRRGTPDGQGPEPAGEAVGHVGVQADARVHTDQQHGHNQRAGQQERQVPAG